MEEEREEEEEEEEEVKVESRDNLLSYPYFFPLFFLINQV